MTANPSRSTVSKLLCDSHVMFPRRGPMARAFFNAYSPTRLNRVSTIERCSRLEQTPWSQKNTLVRNLHQSRRTAESFSPALPFLRHYRQCRRTTPFPLIMRHSLSTSTISKTRSPFLRFCIRALTLAGFFGFMVTGLVVAFFIYDASTYRESSEHEDVSIPELALHPRRGGPKNLPIAEYLVGDEDGPERVALRDKPRLVILGGGWGVSLTSCPTARGCASPRDKVAENLFLSRALHS